MPTSFHSSLYTLGRSLQSTIVSFSLRCCKGRVETAGIFCCDAGCNETTAEPVEITNLSTTSTTATIATTAVEVAAAAEAHDDVSDPVQRIRLDISPQPNDHGELVRAVGSSVVLTCRRVHDDVDDGSDLAAEATTVEWFDKNDVRIRSQTSANRRLRQCVIVRRVAHY